MGPAPYRYQLQDARQLHRFGGRCLLANDMGLGKSKISLMYAEDHPQLRPIIIVCPASLKWNWQNECRMHCGWRAEVLEGTKPEKHNYLKNHWLYILNYDILGAWLPYLKSLTPQLVVLDECHHLQDNRTQRSKASKELCRGVPHVLALSGTPLVNRPVEMFTTLNILRPDLFPSYWSYANAFCGPKRTRWGWDFNGSSNTKQLHALLGQLMIRRRKADVLSELPAKQRIIVPVEISNRGEYEHALRDFLGWLAQRHPTKLTTAERAEGLVKFGYLKRLCAAGKLAAEQEWIDNFLHESTEKLLLFGVHKKVIRTLEQRYRKLCVVVDGSVTGQARQRAVDQFQQNKSTRIFLGNIKAAGVGLNLTAAQTVAFAEMAWTPSAHTQAEDRVYGRLSDLHGATSYWFVARHTVEEPLCALLQEKSTTVDTILDNGQTVTKFDIFDKLTSELSNHD